MGVYEWGGGYSFSFFFLGGTFCFSPFFFSFLLFYRYRNL